MDGGILILAPRGRDAQVAADLLGRNNVRAAICADVHELAARLEAGAGAALVTEEALGAQGLDGVKAWIDAQPAWSDFPFVVLANGHAGARSPRANALLDGLRNVVLLERPLHADAMLRAVRSALAARGRQYEARGRMEALRQSEAALRALNADLEARVLERSMERGSLWQVSPDLFSVIDLADGRFVAVNPAWSATLGWLREEIEGRFYADFVHPDDHAASAEGFAQLLRGDPVLRLENRYRHRGGGWRWLSWVAIPEEGRIYSTTRDITAERERQAELASAQEALRQSQKLETLGQLTGGVAHDFNNLLTPIMGSLDMLHRRGVGDERERRLIDGALQSAERARVLVQRLLAFARRQPLQPVAVDLARLLREMGELVAATTGPGVMVRTEVAAALPAAAADPNQLEMALLNLAVNARDAMPDGGELLIAAAPETVAAGHRAGLPAGDYVRLAVSDTGVGMDAATLARAVEPFFSTKGIGRGTGLGLSMVHGLAAQLGGGMAIDSRPGAGTRVELWLPVAADAPRAVGETTGAPAAPARRAGTALLVDDEVLVRAATADMLADMGYAVREAASAEEAMRLVGEGLAPDLLVTDHLMPGMTGAELARALRHRRPGTPVLVVSGYAEAEGIAPDLPRLTKPFRRDELAALLAEIA